MPRKKVETKDVMSFKGWDLFIFVKDRKKTVVTALATFLAFGITDDATSAVLAGAIVEGVFAVTEYYLKKRQL